MPNLKCNADNCFYNSNCYCCKERIKVSGGSATTCSGTNCSSFKKDSLSNNVYTTEFAKLGDVNEFLSISCESTNCLHNANKVCKAPKVIIGGSDAVNKYETACESFALKL